MVSLESADISAERIRQLEAKALEHMKGVLVA